METSRKQEHDTGSTLRLLMGEAAQFTCVRELLGSAGFDEPTLCQRLKLSQFDHALGLTRQEAKISEPFDCLGILIRLFLLGEEIGLGEARRVVPGEALDALLGLGLIERNDPGKIASPVALYPVGNLFFVSDRCIPPEEECAAPPHDFVFPAITSNTSQFLASLPDSPCTHLLDLCSGTGVAALQSARCAEHVWAIDITERSTQMAEFNRRLNGLENATVDRGDLYTPVADLKFDRIVAHPPYMPAPKAAQVFYDGGTDGEQITRRIVQHLPQHLLPGGCLYCLTMGSDRVGEPFEQRIRAWLGGVESQFDVALVVRRLYSPAELAMRWAIKTSSGPRGTGDFKKALTDLHIETMVYGWVLIQRLADNRPAFTVRRQAGVQCGRSEIARLLKWETAAAMPGMLDNLAEARLAANPSTQFSTTYRLQEGNLVPDPLKIHTDYPFEVSCKAQSWVPQLIAQCNGKATAGELHRYCIENELIDAGTPLGEFLKLLVLLISAGILEVQGY